MNTRLMFLILAACLTSNGCEMDNYTRGPGKSWQTDSTSLPIEIYASPDFQVEPSAVDAAHSAEAISLLEKTSFLLLSEERAAHFGAAPVMPGDNPCYLIRGIMREGGFAGLSVQQKGGTTLLSCGSMGRGPYTLEKYPLLVRLPVPPESLHVTFSSNL